MVSFRAFFPADLLPVNFKGGWGGQEELSDEPTERPSLQLFRQFRLSPEDILLKHLAGLQRQKLRQKQGLR